MRSSTWLAPGTTRVPSHGCCPRSPTWSAAQGEGGSSSLWDDHPSTAARIARASQAAARLPRGVVGRARYLGALDGLPYGRNPRYGYLDRGRFIRPDAGFSLRLPDGWTSKLEGDLLLSIAPGGGELLMLFRTRHATLAGARAAFFDDDVRHDELVQQTTAGFPALVREPIADEKTQAELVIFEARGHAFMLIGGGGKVTRRRRPDLAAALSALGDPAERAVHPRQLRIDKLVRATTLRRLARTKAELSELVLLNHDSPDRRLSSGRFIKRTVPEALTWRGVEAEHHDPIVIGWAELVDIPEWNIARMRAKMDTGARTSALHVENIREVGHGRVRFDVRLHRRKLDRRVTVEAPILRRGTRQAQQR